MTTTSGRLALLAVIILAWFGVFEASLRVAGSSEADPTFRNLFTLDPVIGYRLHPSTSIRYTTSEFSTDISINSAGVRDDEIGPKPPGERRIVVLGDSLVLAVQVPLQQTFCKQLERRLNGRGGATHYRVINAGVQGYGPVEDALFYERVAARLQPDLVVVVVFVANDAIEALGPIVPADIRRPARGGRQARGRAQHPPGRQGQRRAADPQPAVESAQGAIQGRAGGETGSPPADVCDAGNRRSEPGPRRLARGAGAARRPRDRVGRTHRHCADARAVSDRSRGVRAPPGGSRACRLSHERGWRERSVPRGADAAEPAPDRSAAGIEGGATGPATCSLPPRCTSRRTGTRLPRMRCCRSSTRRT